VRALVLGSLLATLVPLASAHAAPGPTGSLAPLSTPQLCFAQTPASGCTTAPGLESARAVAVSADGGNLYVGGGTSISVFQRNAKTGALTQLTGILGCVSSSTGTGCGHALGLSGVAQLGLSPDGRHLYAVSSISGSVTAFARDVTSGALTQLRGAAGCVRPGGGGGCASGTGLAGATALAISPDGHSLYVAGQDANAVASFSIDPVGGALLQLGGKAACVRGGDDPGACLDGRALLGADAARDLARRRHRVRGRQGHRRGRGAPAQSRHGSALATAGPTGASGSPAGLAARRRGPSLRRRPSPLPRAAATCTSRRPPAMPCRSCSEMPQPAC
jgi:hypothetical protein